MPTGVLPSRVLCANPALEGIAHDTIGLQRDLVLNGGAV